MDLDSLLKWLYDTELAVAMRENALLFPVVEALHVVALTLVIGAVAVLDLRLIGVASRSRPLPQLLRDVLPVVWSAFVFAAVSGILLFASNAVAYAHNPPFQRKVALLALIGLNAAAFHILVRPRLRAEQLVGRLPRWAQLSGVISITLWIGVTAFGRWIGFTINALQ